MSLGPDTVLAAFTLCQFAMAASVDARLGSVRSISVLFGTLLYVWPTVGQTIQAVSGQISDEFLQVAFGYGPTISVGFALLLRNRSIHLTRQGLFVTLSPLIALVIAINTGQSILFPIGWLCLAAPALLRRQVPEPLSIATESARVGVTVFALALPLGLLLQPEPAFGACRLDKCSHIGLVVTLGGYQSNLLNISLAIMLPFAARGLSRARFLVLAATALVFADLSGGRSGAIGIIVALTMAWACRSGSTSALLVAKSVTALTIIATVLPVVLEIPDRFATGRAALWRVAKQYIVDSPIVGHGPSFWVRQSATAQLVANYSAHNVWLELMVATGIVGAAAVAAALIVCVQRSSKDLRPHLLGMVTALLACGIFEAPLMPYRLTLVPGALVACLFVSGLRQPSAPERPARLRASYLLGSHDK